MYICCDCSNTISMDIYLSYMHNWFWPNIFVSVFASVKISFSSTKRAGLQLKFYCGLSGECQPQPIGANANFTVFREYNATEQSIYLMVLQNQCFRFFLTAVVFSHIRHYCSQCRKDWTGYDCLGTAGR